MQDIYKSADDLDEDAKNIIKKCLGEDAYYKILYGSTITSDLVCLAGLVSELNAVPGSLDDLPSGRPGKAPETGGESGSKGIGLDNHKGKESLSRVVVQLVILQRILIQTIYPI